MTFPFPGQPAPQAPQQFQGYAAPQAPPPAPAQQYYNQGAPAFQGYPQAPTQQQYAQGGYPQAPPAPPAAPLAQGGTAEFFSQPKTGGGPAWKFTRPGDVNQGIISGEAYSQQDTVYQSNPPIPATHKDGSPKFVLILPMKNVDGSDGRVFMRGDLAAQLAQKMELAGVPVNEQGYREPERGAFLAITLTGKVPAGNVNKNAYDVQYVRPTEQSMAFLGQAAPAAPAPAPQQFQGYPQPPASQAPPAPAQPQFAPPPGQYPALPAGPQFAPAPQAPAPAPAANGGPDLSALGLTPDQMAKLAAITNNPQ